MTSDLKLEALRSTVLLGGTAVILRIGFTDQQSLGSSGGGRPGFLVDAWPVFLRRRRRASQGGFSLRVSAVPGPPSRHAAVVITPAPTGMVRSR